MLVQREPFEAGSVRLRSMDTFSLPSHWALCQVPINGSFVSSSTALMKLHSKIAPRLTRIFKRLGWKSTDIDHFVFHQPSEAMTRRILKRIGADEGKGVYTHHLYGNNASATIGVVFNQLLKERELKTGDKMMFGSAASGFTMGVAAGEWVG
jgi:3-oxoacyl-[acyl-carrier-protein] synthase-3